MRNVQFFLVIGILFVGSGTARAEEYRTWTSSNGKFSIEAKVVEFDGSNVVLESRSDKKTITLTRDKLCDEDGKYLIQWNLRKKNEDDENPFETGASDTPRTSRPTPAPQSTRPATSSRPDSRRPATPSRNASTSEKNDDVDVELAAINGPDKAIPIRFSSAKNLQNPGATQNWSAAPDPAPVATLPFEPRPLSIVEDASRDGQFGRAPSILTCAEKPERMLLTFFDNTSNRIRDVALYVANIETGDVVSTSYNAHLVPCAVSPSGDQGLFRLIPQYGSETPKSRLLVVLDLNADGLPCIAAYEPFREDFERRYIENYISVVWASWFDEENIIAMSGYGHIVLFSTKTRRARWSLRMNTLAPKAPMLSPGGQYLLVSGTKGQLFLVSIRDGRLLGEFTTTETDLTKGTKAFSPDGSRLAVLADTRLSIWDLKKVVPQESCYFGTPGALKWIDSRFLLIGGILINTERRLPVWGYEGTTSGDIMYAGMYWHGTKKGKRFTLTPLTIPHAGFELKPAQASDDEERYSLRPGMEICIKVGEGVPEAEKVRNDFREKVEKNGLTVVEDAPLTLTASVAFERTIDVKIVGRYEMPHSETDPRKIVKWTPFTAKVVIELDGKALLTYVDRPGFPAISGNDAVENYQNLVNQRGTPTVEWFLKSYIPRQILRTEYEISRIDWRGLQ